MPIKTIITVTHNEGATDMTNILRKDTNDPKNVAVALSSYFSAVAGGARHAQIDVQVGEGTSVAASGTLTLGTVVAGNTCSINGVTFTAVASGATGNQFNVGGTAAQTAANLASAINSSSSSGVKNLVTASAASNVVTITTSKKGAHGNLFTLAGGTNITASGANLSGGVEGTPNPQSHGL